MQIPNISRSWDWGPFLLGWIVIIVGLQISSQWALFGGILLVEFGLLMFIFIFIGSVFFDRYSSDSKIKEFLISYFVCAIFILVITSFFLGYIYFGFDPRSMIKVHQITVPSIDVPNITWNFIQNITKNS